MHVRPAPISQKIIDVASSNGTVRLIAWQHPASAPELCSWPACLDISSAAGVCEGFDQPVPESVGRIIEEKILKDLERHYHQ